MESIDRRPDAARIRQAIMNPDADARRMAVRYFGEAFVADPAVMPRVIEAIERYGQEVALPLLRYELPQSAEMVDWLLHRLSLSDLDDDFRAGLSRLLAAADPSLLRPRWSEIRNSPGLVEGALPRIERRLALADEEPEALWKQLEELCRESFAVRYLTDADLPRGNDLVEALARHGDRVRERCMDILRQEIDPDIDDPIVWMEGYMVRLAGLLRLESAVIPLVRKLAAEDDWLPGLAAEALMRIGTDKVVMATRAGWSMWDSSFRLFTANALGRIHSDAAVAACRELLEFEEGTSLGSRLGEAWLEHLEPEAVEAVRREIDENRDDADWLDLCEDVCGAAAILDMPLPAGWREEVL